VVPRCDELLTGGIRRVHDQVWITLALFVLAVFLAREMAGHIVDDDLKFLYETAFGLVACVAGIAILRNWRIGFCTFNVWLLFEDFVRKYMGNGTALFFGKDVLALIIYVALIFAIRRGKEKVFHPPLLLWFPLSIFIWLAGFQIFNPNSPSVLYGLLGFKLDFFYVPMMFVGYALIRHREDLRKFLIGNALLAILICAVGIAQAILGNGFMNPQNISPDLIDTINLEKIAPISGRVVSLPNSIFVSSGRFSLYLTLAVTLCIGTAGYLLLSTKRNRKVIFTAIGAIGTATMFSGSRVALIFVSVTAVVMSIGLLWGAPWRSRMVHRTLKVIAWSSAIVAIGLSLAVVLYPEEVGSRIAFYSETLNPFSSASVLQYRGITYPFQNLATAFDDENWLFGNGTGTASLGLQYVAMLLHSPYRGKWTESGWGELMLEMGILAPLLWVVWASTLVWCSSRVVRSLRQTAFFPLGFAILWFAFTLLIPMTFGGTSAYQNYVNNAFLWLLVGILFRLPELAALAEEPVPESQQSARGWLPFLRLGPRKWKPRPVAGPAV
jgi:hypothetical protein